MARGHTYRSVFQRSKRIFEFYKSFQDLHQSHSHARADYDDSSQDLLPVHGPVEDSRFPDESQDYLEVKHKCQLAHIFVLGGHCVAELSDHQKCS